MDFTASVCGCTGQSVHSEDETEDRMNILRKLKDFWMYLGTDHNPRCYGGGNPMQGIYSNFKHNRVCLNSPLGYDLFNERFANDYQEHGFSVN